MSIFISYSHQDAGFVDHLALELVKHNTYIWLDKWELRIGDSLIDKIQAAISNSDALLVVISKASVASTWCKKELAAGLTRELSEKRVVVLPIIIDDSEVPLFLQDKVRVDFRKDFENGLKDVLNEISAVSNPNRARAVVNTETGIDWGIFWTYVEDLFQLRCTFVQFSKDYPFTLVLEVYITCNSVATKRYQQWEGISLDWFGRQCIIESASLIVKDDAKILIEGDSPVYKKATISDPKSEMSYDINIEVRRLGADTGKSILLDVNMYLKYLRDHLRTTFRKLTKVESERAAQLFNDNQGNA